MAAMANPTRGWPCPHGGRALPRPGTVMGEGNTKTHGDHALYTGALAVKNGGRRGQARAGEGRPPCIPQQPGLLSCGSSMLDVNRASIVVLFFRDFFFVNNSKAEESRGMYII